MRSYHEGYSAPRSQGSPDIMESLQDTDDADQLARNQAALVAQARTQEQLDNSNATEPAVLRIRTIPHANSDRE